MATSGEAPLRLHGSHQDVVWVWCWQLPQCNVAQIHCHKEKRGFGSQPPPGTSSRNLPPPHFHCARTTVLPYSTLLYLAAKMVIQ